MAFSIGLPVKTEAVITRKTTYTQKDTGVEKFLAQVAGIGWEIPVFFETRLEYEACPPAETMVSLSGKMAHTKDGAFRMQDVKLVPVPAK